MFKNKKRTNMKKISPFLLLLAMIIMIVAQSCEDYFNPEPGKDYDIDWPRPEPIIDFENLTVDTQYEITGNNLDKVFQVFFGTDQAAIIDTLNNKITIKTPRLFDRSIMVMRNYYNYSYHSELLITPIFLPVTIDQWPASVDTLSGVTLYGQNVDQLDLLIIDTERIKINGRNIDDTTYQQIFIPINEYTFSPDLSKVLLKAIAKDGSFFQAPDSVSVN